MADPAQPLPNAPLGEYQPWLANLNDPTKLTADQRLACGIGAAWTCNVRSGRAGCQAALAAETNKRRARCDQLAAIGPPPSTAPAPTNPQADPGAAPAAAEQQAANAEYLASTSSGQPIGTVPMPELFAPEAQVVRDPEAVAPTGLLGLPTWSVLAAAALVAWLVFRGR